MMHDQITYNFESETTTFNPCNTCGTNNFILFLWDPIIGYHCKCKRCNARFFSDGCEITTLEEIKRELQNQKEINKVYKDTLKKQDLKIHELSNLLKTLQEKVEAVYFAPYMPGYFESFENYTSIG
jgi:hypothetical protein